MQGKLHEALEGLLNLEKTARQAEDIAALRASCSAILTACYDAKEWKLLEEHVVLLSKRRGQMRQVRGEMGLSHGQGLSHGSTAVKEGADAAGALGEAAWVSQSVLLSNGGGRAASPFWEVVSVWNLVLVL